MYGYRQEHDAEIGRLGQAACPKGRAQNDYPQGHAGAFYGGQSGQESAERKQCPKGRIELLFLFREVTEKPSAFESEIHPSHKPAVCTLGISPLQGAGR